MKLEILCFHRLNMSQAIFCLRGYPQTCTCKAFDHKQFSNHSLCYKARKYNYGEIADTDGEGGGGRVGEEEQEKGGVGKGALGC